MNNKVFFDSNILVYAYDTHDPVKQKIAKALIIDNIRNEKSIISTQVLGEFFNVVTKRIPNPLSSEEARQAINHLSIIKTTHIDTELIHRAIDAHQQYKTTYWDSLIIAAAEREGCSKILSEDFNTGQLYFGVIADNPFI